MMLAQSFVGPPVAWFALSPLLVLLGGGVVLLVAAALTPRWPGGLYAAASATTAGVAAVLCAFQWDDISDEGTSTLVGGALAFDTFAILVAMTICIAVVLASLLTDDYLRAEGDDGPEVYAMYLMAAIGGIVMGAANDLIVLFVGLETLSLALYVLAASNRRRAASQESGIKYFVLGSFASAFFLYGIALVYGASGSTNITEIVSFLQGNIPLAEGRDSLLLAGVALLIVGLAFKVTAVPFHVWAPDVYQGAPSPITAFMASAGKAAAFAAMLRVLVTALPFTRDDWRPAVWVLAVLSLVVGSALAVVQSDVKRMLAYSSISHAGYLLVGVEAAGHRAGETDLGSGVPSVLVYLLLYAVLVIGSFGVVAVVGGGDESSDISAFRGLAKRRPLLAVAFTVFLLAQAGVPFTSGFIAKFGVISAAVDERSYALAIIAMIAAVIGAFVYLRIMVSMWASEPAAAAARVHVPLSSGLAIGLAAMFTLFVGFLPNWLLDAADTVTQLAR
jgi:NADH-quinone oxidoreductase subunit N